MLWIAFAAAAFAADLEQKLTWDVQLDGKPIGYRTLTAKWYFQEDGTERRVLQVWTELDASILGLEYQFRERLTANIGNDVAAFHAVSDLSGDITEVQARKSGGEWILSSGYDGSSATKEWPASAIDLSTADLIDPGSRFPLSHYDVVRVLSAETGDIWQGPVNPLGTSTISVAGDPVPVTGYEWSPEDGEARFWYSADGYLVRYEITVLGKELVGTLTEPPPLGTDEAPVNPAGNTLQEISL